MTEQLKTHNDRLVSAAKKGALIVCSDDGETSSADALIGALDLTTEASPDLPIPNRPHYLLADSHEIDALHVKLKHLIAWATKNGDEFQIVQVPPSEVITSDLVNWQTGKILEPGYRRAIVTYFDESESPQGDTVLQAATTAPVSELGAALVTPDAPVVEVPTGNQSAKTIAYEAEVRRQMTMAWNNRSPGTDPKKKDLHRQVYEKMKLGDVKPQRASHSIDTVIQAAKKWNKAEVVAAQNLPVKPPESLPSKEPEQAGETRHQWKGNR